LALQKFCEFRKSDEPLFLVCGYAAVRLMAISSPQGRLNLGLPANKNGWMAGGVEMYKNDTRAEVNG